MIIDKIKAEADAIVCDKEQRIKVLERELAEALVYGERLRKPAKDLSFGLVHDDPEWNPSKYTDKAFSSLQDALSEQPPAALAALKAEWQAEAIESILNLDHGYMQFEDGSFAYTEESISGYAESIRQRAQEAYCG